MNQPEAVVSSQGRRTFFKVSSHLGGVELHVSLADLLLEEKVPEESKAPAAGLHTPETFGHQLIMSATIVSSDRPTICLDDRCMWAITVPMLEDINSLCRGWLSISELHAWPSKVNERQTYVSRDGTVPSTIQRGQHAVTLTLVPVRIPQDLTANRRFRVDLEWIDSRNERAVPLADLFQHASLPLHLRDLVSQLVSCLLIEVLLRDATTAKLYHRSWQDRQKETVPLISSIAASMRSLLSRASNPSNLDPLLQRLQLSRSLPSVITIANLLTELDLARHSPSVPHFNASIRSRSQLHQSRRTIVLPAEFAPDGADSDFDWIDADSVQPRLEAHSEDEQDNVESIISFAPDLDQDGNETGTDAAWAEILRFSQGDQPQSGPTSN